MKRILVLTLIMCCLTACSKQETVKPYEKPIQQEKIEESLENENNTNKIEETNQNIDNTNQLNNNEQLQEETQEESPEDESSTNQIDDENVSNETTAEIIEDTIVENTDIEEEIIDNGAISDRNLSMGRAYIGNIELTTEKVVNDFSRLSSYENNELTQQVVDSVIDYLNNYSEYKLINLWQEYDNLEQHQRYALITLTTYTQSFGGYNKSSMSKALSNSEIYKNDIKSIDNDLK